MRRLHLVLDLSLLRAPPADRAARLQHLVCAISRVWATYHAADASFAYTLYDSSTGDYMLSSKLQRVAAALSERSPPRRCPPPPPPPPPAPPAPTIVLRCMRFFAAEMPSGFQASAGADLSGRDLVHLLRLVEKATDEAFLQEFSIRERRTSRSGGVPAEALAHALQAALGGAYLQKLARDDADSGSSGQGAEGAVVFFTTAVGDPASLAQFLGAAGDAAPPAPGAAAAALPAQVWERAAALGVRLCWVPAEDEGDQDAAGAALQPLRDALRQRCPAAEARALPALAGDAAPAAFAALAGLPARQEEGTAAARELWPAQGDGIDGLVGLVAALEPRADPAAAAGAVAAAHKRLLREAHKKLKGGPPGAAGKRGAQAEPAGGRRGRRVVAAAAAAGARGEGSLAPSAAAGDGSARPSAVPGGAPGAPPPGEAAEVSSVAPLSLDDSVACLSEGVAALVQRLAGGEGGPAGPSAGAGAAAGVRELVAAAVAAVLK
jgi:hypothetical protein